MDSIDFCKPLIFRHYSVPRRPNWYTNPYYIPKFDPITEDPLDVSDSGSIYYDPDKDPNANLNVNAHIDNTNTNIKTEGTENGENLQELINSLQKEEYQQRENPIPDIVGEPDERKHNEISDLLRVRPNNIENVVNRVKVEVEAETPLLRDYPNNMSYLMAVYYHNDEYRAMIGVFFIVSFVIILVRCGVYRQGKAYQRRNDDESSNNEIESINGVKTV